MNKQSQIKRWQYLLTCSVGLLFVGILYAWSIMKVPLAEQFAWTNSQLAFTYTLTMCFFCLGSLFSGWVGGKIRENKLLIIGGAMILAGYLVTAAMTGRWIGTLYIAYGFLIGGGIGIAYNVLLSTGSAWFPDRKGTSSGLMMMCFGFSTMVLGKLASKLFAIPSIGWRKTFIGLGGSIFLILFLCARILKKPGQDIVLPKAAAEKEGAPFASRDYTAAEMIRRPTFWIYYLYGVLGAAVGSSVFSFARELAMSFHATEAFATTLVGLLSIGNGLGRILCGLSYDSLGRGPTMLSSSVITLASPLLMLSAIAVHSLPLATVSLCLAGISFGTNPTISSAFIRAFYGGKNFPLNYSISNTKLLFSSFAATAASALLDSTGSYTAPFLLLLGMAAVSLLLNFLIRHP